MSVFMICERALGLLRGKRLILSAQEQSLLETLNYVGLTACNAQEEAITCARHFAFVRDRLLQLHPWVFARKTVALATYTTPVSGWGYAYSLPTDCLTVLGLIETHGTLTHWEQMGRIVLCNHPKIQVRYTARIEDTTLWTPSFTSAFCASLASEMGAAITGETENAIALQQQAQLLLSLEQRSQLALDEAHRNGDIRMAGELPLRRATWLDYSGSPSRFEQG